MTLLEDFLSKDPHRIWSSSCAVRRLREPEQLALLAANLEQIRRSTQGIDLGGAMRPNSTHLSFALRKLEYVKAGTGCLCRLYPEDNFYDPRDEQRDGRVRITATVATEKDYDDCSDCECTVCGAQYRVFGRDYHYSWWEWRPL